MNQQVETEINNTFLISFLGCIRKNQGPLNFPAYVCLFTPFISPQLHKSLPTDTVQKQDL